MPGTPAFKSSGLVSRLENESTHSKKASRARASQAIRAHDACCDLAGTSFTSGDASIDEWCQAGLNYCRIDADWCAPLIKNGNAEMGVIADADITHPAVTCSASAIPPRRQRAAAGDAAIAQPPSPIVSTIALSPMSGLAWSGPKLGKYSPFGKFTGAGTNVRHVPRRVGREVCAIGSHRRHRRRMFDSVCGVGQRFASRHGKVEEN